MIESLNDAFIIIDGVEVAIDSVTGFNVSNQIVKKQMLYELNVAEKSKLQIDFANTKLQCAIFKNDGIYTFVKSVEAVGISVDLEAGSYFIVFNANVLPTNTTVTSTLTLISTPTPEPTPEPTPTPELTQNYGIGLDAIKSYVDNTFNQQQADIQNTVAVFVASEFNVQATSIFKVA